MSLSSRSLDVLEARGYVRPDGRLRRSDIAADIATFLLGAHVADDVDSVAERVATLDEICVGLFGESHPELRSLVVQLSSVAPAGAVQRSLENGHVLCATSVYRIVGQVDGQVTRRFSGRFLSEDPDVVKRYSLAPLISMAERAMVRIRSRAELVARRVPALQNEVQLTLDLAGGRARAALAAGDEAASGS